MSHPCTAFLCELGHDDEKNAKDNKVQGKIDMTKYLVISVNGNGKDDNTAVPTESQINSASPVGVYTGNIAGGYLSPTDSNTTNYLVISGQICMMSEKVRCTHRGDELDRTDYPVILSHIDEMITSIINIPYYWHQTVHLDDSKNGDGAYYAVKFYTAATPQSTPQAVTTHGNEGLFPYNNAWKDATDLKYAWSAEGSEEDKMYKFPMLAVEIKVGDKYCCETINQDGTSSYSWRTLEDCPKITYNGESQTKNYIYIGPNPAIDDFIIGKQWDMASNVTPEMNIDADGIAIPIKKSDGLSGKMSVRILGPVNSTFQDIVRTHPSFWRHTRWDTYTRSVLGRTAAIFIKDFDMKIYSDNAAINNIPGDRDLVYMTDINGLDSVSKMDDIEFDICTALTTEECAQKGIKNSVKMNNPYIGKEPLTSVKNVVLNETAKPEEHYLSHYYDEYCSPKLILQTTIRTSVDAAWLKHWSQSTLENKLFMCQGYSYNAKRDTFTMTLKEE